MVHDNIQAIQKQIVNQFFVLLIKKNIASYNENWHKYNKQHNLTGNVKTLSHIYKYNKDEIPKTIRLTIRVWVVFWFMNFLNRSLMIINYIDSSRMGHTLWNFHVWNSMGEYTK